MSGDVVKHGLTMRISDEMAMDYGLIPDTREPLPPPSRRKRWRWRAQDAVTSARYRLARWISPYDLDEEP